MRDLPRKDRVAMTALANAIEHEPALRPVLVEDYARARLDFKEARALRDFLARRLAAASRHPEEPGSMSAIPSAVVLPSAHARMRVPDWLAPYGSEDHTSFGIGCIY